MFDWLRDIFRNVGDGYTCDGCNRWTPRKEGKATVRYVLLTAPRLGKLPPMSVNAVLLDCPTCAAKRKEAAA